MKDWIIFEDEHLLVMNKPAGLFTTPGRFEKRCLLNEARALRAEAEVVHRLDLDTSGLVVFGCSKRGISGLNQLFRERRIDKQYVAQVAGTALVDAPPPAGRLADRKAGPDAVSGSGRIRLADETGLDARNGRSPSTSTAPCLDWAAYCGMRFVCAGVGACVGGAVNAACSEVDLCASRNERSAYFRGSA